MKNKKLSLENRLIINCATTLMDEQSYSSSLDIMKKGLNWEYIYETAQAHNVAPLMYPNLEKLNKDYPIPQSIFSQFRKSYHSTGIRNAKLYNELAVLLKDFKENGIEVMLIKGAALAILVYKNIALRPMSDVDILVKKEDAWKIRKILIKKGYEEDMPLKRKFFTKFSTCLPSFTRRKLTIEVKWRINYFLNGIKPDYNSYEKSSENITIIDNVSTQIPSPKDLLLLVYHHLKKHNIRGESILLWYCDLIEIKRRYKIGYELEDSFSPYEILENFKSKSEDHYFMSGIHMDIKSIDGIYNKFFYILGSLFPNRKFLCYRYKTKSATMAYLYFFLRPFIGIFKIFKNLLIMLKNI